MKREEFRSREEKDAHFRDRLRDGSMRVVWYIIHVHETAQVCVYMFVCVYICARIRTCTRMQRGKA